MDFFYNHKSRGWKWWDDNLLWFLGMVHSFIGYILISAQLLPTLAVLPPSAQSPRWVPPSTVLLSQLLLCLLAASPTIILNHSLQSLIAFTPCYFHQIESATIWLFQWFLHKMVRWAKAYLFVDPMPCAISSIFPILLWIIIWVLNHALLH